MGDGPALIIYGSGPVVSGDSLMRSCAIVVAVAVADDDVEFFTACAAFVGGEFHLENLLVLDVYIIRRYRRNVNRKIGNYGGNYAKFLGCFLGAPA